MTCRSRERVSKPSPTKRHKSCLVIDDMRAQANVKWMLLLAVLGPLVLATNLLLLLGGEVVGDVESLADLLGRLALDHVGDSLAANIKQGLDIHVVGSENDLEEHFLVDLHVLLVPLVDLGGLLTRLGILVGGGGRVVAVVFAPLQNLLQDGTGDVGQGHGLASGHVHAQILNHVLDEERADGDIVVDSVKAGVIGLESDLDGGVLSGVGVRHFDDCCFVVLIEFV